MWAEDPVCPGCSVVELPEIARMEARTSANAQVDTPSRPFEVPLAIMGVPFSPLTLPETIARIEQMIASRKGHYIVTANVDFLVQARSDVELHRILVEADLVLCDGQPLVWASRWLGKGLPERVAGSDLVPQLVQLSAQRGYRIFFLGGSPQVAAQAVTNMQAAYPGLNVCGFYSPPFNPLLEMDHEDIRHRIAAARPDVLFVSLGCPKAEKWMAMHFRSLGVPVAIGVGGTIDFLAQRLKRAPQWMRGAGIEWLFRLLQEPQRLGGRYARDAREFASGLAQQLWWLKLRRPRGLHSGGAIVEVVEPSWQRIRAPESFALPFLEEDRETWFAPLKFGAGSPRNRKRHCLVEVSAVRFIDSAAVGLLLELQRRLAKEELCLILLDPSEAVRRAIRVLRLEHFFLTARDTVEARELIRGRVQQRNVTALSAHTSLPLVWQGEITAANAEQIWTIAEAQIDSFPDYGEPITIDLSAVRFIDSTGVSVLLRTQKYASSKGGNLRFLNPGPAVRNVLRVARLEGLLLDESSAKPKMLRETLGLLEPIRAQWPSLRQRKAGL